MKITSVSTALLEPMPWVLVKVRTDEGLIGIGEAYHGAGVHQIAVDHRLMRPLIGQDPRNVDKLFRDMRNAMSASGFYQGAVMSAISGIEMALWDITGQSFGVPIWQLLGGKFRDRIRVYNDCHEGDDNTPKSWAEKAKAVEARGFDAIKFDIDPQPTQRDKYNRGISNENIDFFVNAVATIREALHPNTDLLIDAHWFYSPSDILKVAQGLESLNLLWLEDPIPPENIDVMAMVTRSTSLPICTGENFYTAHGFRELIEKQASDIISPDLAKSGGLLEGRKIADLANLYYIPYSPHNISGPIGTVAACHVCAAVENFQVLEFHHLDNELWNGLTIEQDLIIDGHITIPESPGLGVTLNENVAREACKEDLGFFE
ncbi:MAG: D-galactonate dehydratase [Candidatus Moanabacter tarae]|uniref:D-galactonate dehydratase n=1 Tax=Candidatus Moanibacter tarae TaxID=2200854 RepID=A0A2Z4AL08_9BACT|nr:MAG: D-galactonate dehydratase [Candidatus Moanabacter tarae]|tara:strand:- start:22957 stop:24081 length:1125 start_codon:yes stop_codon:yes gene_type:complete